MVRIWFDIRLDINNRIFLPILNEQNQNCGFGIIMLALMFSAYEILHRVYVNIIFTIIVWNLR